MILIAVSVTAVSALAIGISCLLGGGRLRFCREPRLRRKQRPREHVLPLAARGTNTCWAGTRAGRESGSGHAKQWPLPSRAARRAATLSDWPELVREPSGSESREPRAELARALGRRVTTSRDSRLPLSRGTYPLSRGQRPRSMAPADTARDSARVLVPALVPALVPTPPPGCTSSDEEAPLPARVANLTPAAQPQASARAADLALSPRAAANTTPEVGPWQTIIVGPTLHLTSS